MGKTTLKRTRPELFLPWKKVEKRKDFRIEDVNGLVVADYLPPSFADFIVRAVNSHDKLLEALEAMLEGAGPGFAGIDEELRDSARAALAAAKGVL